MRKVILTLALLVTVILQPTDTLAQRTTDNQLALYDFNEAQGRYIAGRDCVPLIIDVTIDPYSDSFAYRDTINWSDGGLLVKQPVNIESPMPATDITASIVASNELTLEVWVVNSTTNATGPARILSLSQSGDDGGNFVVGQMGQGLQVRLRTTETDQWGIPAFYDPSVFSDQSLKHIVYTRDTIGNITVYVNGISIGGSFVGGQLSNWGDYTLTMACESNDDGSRYWPGELRMCAIYNRALTAQEVMNNYQAGETPILFDVIPAYNPTCDARAGWGVPTYGTTPVRYIVELSVDDGPWIPYATTDMLHVDIQVTFFNGHRMRVAAIDADDRQGPFSEPSNIYVPAWSKPWPADKPTKEQ